MSLALDILFYTPFIFIILYFLANLVVKTPKNVCIVVLGDIGRSPRMQYHALSFAKEGYRVYLVGYMGSKPLDSLLKHEQVSIHGMAEPPGILKYAPRLVAYVIKVFWQCVTLSLTLLLLPKMSSIFVQNPPSIPTMAVCYLVCRVRFAEFVVDWHNYGHTILALAHSNKNLLVRFSRWYEKFCGRLSTYNICVTEAMKDDLSQQWGIRASVVYDRPPSMFRTASIEEQHILFQKLSKEYSVFGAREPSPESSCTVFTKKDEDGKVTKIEKRPALLVSSTSWTEDEDFGVLMSSLEAYEESKRNKKDLPDLVCIITGKGPQKSYYKERIESREWSGIHFCLPWLEAEDYPTLLGSADLGVCLHTSSSGLDLPMKVVDMFGCGLPVCAINFKCIDELVQHNKNGLVFSDSKELASQMEELLTDFPSHCSKLCTLRENLRSFQSQRWHQCWQSTVLPIFQEIGNKLSSPSTPMQGKNEKKTE